MVTRAMHGAQSLGDKSVTFGATTSPEFHVGCAAIGFKAHALEPMYKGIEPQYPTPTERPGEVLCARWLRARARALFSTRLVSYRRKRSARHSLTSYLPCRLSTAASRAALPSVHGVWA